MPTLERLVEDGHDVRLVVTQPDRPAGRGLKLSPSPVKHAAERLGISQRTLRYKLARLREAGIDVPAA